MRRLALLATVLCAVLVGGCASAVSPLYLKTDAVTDPAIIGTWTSSDKDDPGTIRIAKAQGFSYEISVTEAKSGTTTVYDAHLVELGGSSFADLFLTKFRQAGQDIELPAGAVALHQIVKYRVAGDDLYCSGIDGDALGEAAKQIGFSLELRDTEEGGAGEVGGSTVILSATKELRRYFSAHPADIFGEASQLKRQH
jgi:hypothetical protein